MKGGEGVNQPLRPSSRPCRPPWAQVWSQGGRVRRRSGGWTTQAQCRCPLSAALGNPVVGEEREVLGCVEDRPVEPVHCPSAWVQS